MKKLYVYIFNRLNNPIFLIKNKNNIICIIILTILFGVFLRDISLSDFSIFNCLFYGISFTFSLFISSIYNWSENLFVRTIQKSIFYILLFIIAVLLLNFFGLNLIETIYCDSDVEVVNFNDNSNNNFVVTNESNSENINNKGKDMVNIKKYVGDSILVYNQIKQSCIYFISIPIFNNNYKVKPLKSVEYKNSKNIYIKKNFNNRLISTKTGSDKKIISRIIYGIRTGLELPILPENINRLEKNIFVRGFKLVGAFCMFLVLTKYTKQLDVLQFYIIHIVSIAYIFYKLFIVYHSIVQWFKNLLSGKFIVRIKH